MDIILQSAILQWSINMGSSIGTTPRIGYTGDTNKLFWPFQSDWIPFFDKKYKVPALISQTNHINIQYPLSVKENLGNYWKFMKNMLSDQRSGSHSMVPHPDSIVPQNVNTTIPYYCFFNETDKLNTPFLCASKCISMQAAFFNLLVPEVL